MNKFSTRFLIIVLTFLVGISSVTSWLYYQESQKNQLILPNSRWEQIFFNGVEGGRDSINQVTKLAGLTELRKISLKKGDIEIRVWRGFSTLPLEGVVLKRTDNQWSARYIAESYDDFGKVEMKELNAPKSGWESFWKQIVDKEILTLPDSSEINCGDGGIDAISNVVEINQKRTYRTYRLSKDYSAGKCRPANQMEEIADIIGEEFYSGIEQCRRAEWFACTKARKLNKLKNQ